jgi:MFS superfamily sulfate permease-like transporter
MMISITQFVALVALGIFIETASAFTGHVAIARGRARILSSPQESPIISSHLRPNNRSMIQKVNTYRPNYPRQQHRHHGGGVTHLNMGGSGAISSSDDNPILTSTKPTLLQDILAGITVAFSLLSKAIACSAIVGVNPLVGIWSSVIMGLTSPILRAQSGVISGTAAVVVVPLSALTVVHGTEYMTLCILLSAIMQGLFGIFRLANMTANLVTDEVLSGFLNGLGGILFVSQVKVFKAAKTSGTFTPAVAMAALCYSIVQLLPRITKIVPSSLVGLVVTSFIASSLKLPLATLSSTAVAGTFSGGVSSLPRFISFSTLQSQAKSLNALKLVLPASISIMIIALVETLLAGKVVKDMVGNSIDDTTATNNDDDIPTQSVLAMSAGNIISASLGGFGGCGLIPQSVLNIKSGGGGPMSSISYALAMSSFVLFFAPLVGKIPEAVLAAIMLTVATDTVAWGPTLTAIQNMIYNPSPTTTTGSSKVSRIQRIIEFGALAITSYICYFGNLAVGIVAGVAFQRGLLSINRHLDSGTK